jgi:Fe-S-cluster-containing hydrogenase component 2
MAAHQVRRIFIQKEKCNGCRICELRCSFEHELTFSSALSRIYIQRKEMEGIAIPKTCIICGKCIETCPENVISKSEKTGAISIDEENCTSCGECVTACPYDVMKIHPLTNKAMTCDLCNGNPQCVKYCPEDVLHYMTAREFSSYRKEEVVRKEKEKPKVVP